MKRFSFVLAAAAAALLLAPPAVADEGEIKIMTVTDEACFVPGMACISSFNGAPSPNQGSRAAQMPGWPLTIGADSMFKPSRGLVFADLNGDGPLDIIASSTDNKLYAWDHTGTAMPGFPVTLNNMAQYAPSVSDLDGDGDLEIVQFTRGWTDGGRFYIIDHLGNMLPGFPINVNNNNLSGGAPAIFDLDDDGIMEILVPERVYPLGSLHIFEIDGTEWAGGWPVTLDHVPTGTPAIGDVDNDGAVEIVYLSYDSIYLLEVDGSIMAGWPKQIVNANFSYQSAALADLDGNGDLEIVLGAHKDAAGCYVFHHDGATYPGWPKLLGSWTYCPPTVTDLENDGELEILDGRAGGFGGTSNCFWAWTESGTTKPGFPYKMSHGGGSDGPLIVADVDNDGLMEIFADHNITEYGDGYLFGVDSAGNDLPGFPLRPRGFTYMNGAAIGDVDGDGDYELGVLSYHDYGVDVNLYDLTEIYHPANVSWECYHKRNRRGGLHRSEDRLHIQGTFALGSMVNFYVHDLPGRFAFLWPSRGTNLNLHPLFGWVYIDSSLLLTSILFNEVIPAAGEVVASVTIPNYPGIAGMTFYFQGLHGVNPLGGDGTLTNMLGRTVQ